MLVSMLGLHGVGIQHGVGIHAQVCMVLVSMLGFAWCWYPCSGLHGVGIHARVCMVLVFMLGFAWCWYPCSGLHGVGIHAQVAWCWYPCSGCMVLVSKLWFASIMCSSCVIII